MATNKQNTLYDRVYSEQALPSEDWLVKRGALAALAIKELRIGPADHVLDLGCDDGFMLKEVAKTAPNIVGIDVNLEAVTAANDSRVQAGDATRLEFPDAHFTKIYSSHTIEHVADLRALFREVARVLAPGGEALFIYPWELFRGMAAMRSAMKLTGNPLRGRDFHVHKLNPKKLRDFWDGLPLVNVRSRLVFLRTPQWVTHLRRSSGV